MPSVIPVGDREIALPAVRIAAGDPLWISDSPTRLPVRPVVFRLADIDIGDHQLRVIGAMPGGDDLGDGKVGVVRH